MTFRKLVNQLHLYLGLISGVVVFLVSVTGCILAFEQEIKNITHPFRFVTVPEKAVVLAPSELVAKAEKIVGKKANGILYGVSGRSAEVGFYNFDPEYYYVAYVNPYTGQVLQVWNEDEDFFHFILHGHYYAWLPEKIGQTVVASSTLIFLFMMISGLLLWWPKNKSAAKQRFSIKWNAAWRRKNYDLHNVLGFYIIALGLLFAITGLVWGFAWFSQSLYAITGGKGSDAYVIPPSDTTKLARFPAPIAAVDRVWKNLQAEYPANQGMNISIPGKDSESIYSYVNFRAGTYYKVDYNYFDVRTLKKIDVEGPYTGKYAEASFAKKLRRMNYDIHIGAIWGLPGKLLAFFGSLVCASLPITGFIIWWGRRKKAPKPRRTTQKAPTRISQYTVSK